MDEEIKKKYERLKKEVIEAKRNAQTCGQLVTVYQDCQMALDSFCREHNLPLESI